MPRCATSGRCDDLDRRLLEARKPLLRCIARQGKHSNLNAAHRCFRALRLLESARWWLETLTAETGFMPRVYRVPTETVRNQFLCSIEAMTQANSAEEVERIYLKIVRSYP